MTRVDCWKVAEDFFVYYFVSQSKKRFHDNFLYWSFSSWRFTFWFSLRFCVRRLRALNFFQFLTTVIFIVEVMNNIAKIVLSWNIIIGEASFVLFSVFVGAATTTYRRKRSSQTARAQAKARRSSVTFCTPKYPIYITVHHSVTQQHNKAHATSKTIKPYTK